MNSFPSKETVTRLREQYPKGCRVELVQIDVSGRGVLSMLGWAVVYPEEMGTPVLDRQFTGTAMATWSGIARLWSA